MDKKQRATAPAVTKYTYTLKSPITIDGETLTEVSLCEPELRHRIASQRSNSGSEIERFIVYVAALSGLPESTVRRLKHRDGKGIRELISQVSLRGVRADLMQEAADGNGLSVPQGGRKTFDLLVPIPTDGDPLRSIDVEEPDVAAGLAVEKFKTEGEQVAALIATMSGQIIPLITRMRECDVKRIERWFDFFLNDGASSRPELSAPEASGTGPAGVT